MRDQITGALGRIVAMFKSFTPGQKAVTMAAVLGLAVGGVFFAKWTSTPSYAPLFSGIAPADASAIVDKLDASKVPYKLADGGGTIMVPQDQVYDQRLKMSGAGLPTSGTNGYDLMDKQGVTTSDFQQHVTYQRAMEGEIAKTIESMDGVQQSIVHLAIPQQDAFANDTAKPTASVLVKVQPGKDLTTDQVQSIVHLTASSIQDLNPAEVTVADANGKLLSTDGSSGTVDGLGNTRAEQTAAYNKQTALDVQTMLDQVVGPGHAVVKVNADLNYDDATLHSEKYSYTKKLPSQADTTTTEKYKGTSPAIGGVLGPDNNTGGTTGTGNGYDKKSQTNNRALNKTTEDVKKAPGTVNKMNISVLLDAATSRNIPATKINSLVEPAVAFNAKRGDTINVSQLPFDTSVAKQNAAELAAAAKAEQRAQLMQTGRIGLLVFAILLLGAIAWFSARRKRKKEQKLYAAELERLDELQAEIADAERKALDAARGNSLALEAAPVDPADGRRANQEGEINGLIDSQPEDVALVLRGWLADRRS